ncbi:hypothetical protein TEA_000492 [Camellia sinensis var. sinensis]|uniref:Uncharacterized protein n=2 Tax=Camellia sinensis TaxID=4442 RepID=A0A4S4DDP2_CAMSN|nr:hypothetical protein TEA_000492 [Camellia sinensis var. sinensis]
MNLHLHQIHSTSLPANLSNKQMKPSSILLICTVILTLTALASASSDAAYPSPYGGGTCKSDDNNLLIPVRREVYDDFRIFDISHRYTPDMPSWGSDEGLGQFLWLPASMKNGSLANNSEMKLPTHTGTHVDAPGHVFDHYFDAGFDVDTLDLAVLNGRKMRSLLVLPLCVTVLAIFSSALSSSPSDAYPSGYGDDLGSCRKRHTGEEGLVPLRREVYGNGRIFDITHRFTPETPVGGTEGVGQILSLSMSMKNGSDYNFSIMKLPVHSGTHVDAPGHVFEHYFDAGFDVDTLDLDVLNGPALLVDVPRDKNITADVMKSLNIPKGVRRVLFRTLNTDRRLMWKKEFDTSYVGFMKDGAQWLVDNTDIKLVGIDYLSVAAYDDLIPSHLVFLEGREIILVEGLKLEDIQLGIYNVHCLPLRLLGAEGSPIRCILIK